MKLSVRTTQIILVLGALVLISGLVLAPRVSAEKQAKAETNPVNLKLHRPPPW